ncbi:hypothetical protein, partial [Salmonella sp. SAL4355]|uniref:hypothetical protein n=1 Tax=Salmonella sp. SAL4355 TaxID=3159876 RepID=UPI00397E65D7
MKTLIATLVIALSAMAAPAYAGSTFYDGNEMNANCASDNAFRAGVCLGAVAMVSELVPDDCIPDRAKLGQLR